MAYEIDPFAELKRFLPTRQVNNIRKLLGPDSPLSPGEKVRAAKAFDRIDKDLEREGVGEIKLAKGEKRDAGVRFYIEPPYSKPALREKVAMSLLPATKCPQAWHTSSGGGQVKAEVSPLEG